MGKSFSITIQQFGNSLGDYLRTSTISIMDRNRIDSNITSITSAFCRNELKLKDNKPQMLDNFELKVL